MTRPVDDRTGDGETDAEDLLRELIPEEQKPQPARDSELPVWAQVPAESTDQELVAAFDEPGGEPGVTAQETLRHEAAPLVETARPRRRRRSLFWIIIGTLLGLALLAAVFQLGFVAGSDSASDDPAEVADDATSDADDADGADAAAEENPAAPAATDDAEADAADSGGAAATGPPSTLKLTLDNYQFNVEGVVPSEEIKEAIDTRMGLVFADFGTSDIVVDPTAAPAPWLEGAPGLINTMVLLHDGTIDITDEGVEVSGRALQTDFDRLAGALSAENGFPPFAITDQEIVNKEPPKVRAVAMGDQVTLTGELADETMQSTIVDGAKAVYGTDNVIDETTVNPERHNRFLIMRFPSNMAAYKVFGDYDIRGENESFTAILRSGLVFDVAETELTDESRDRLTQVMFTLTRNPLPVTVTGHTDSVGSESDNQLLSERRAESVAAFLEANGVLSENIVAVEGKGEAEPVAENTSEDGRARNRRVEIIVGLYNE